MNGHRVEGKVFLATTGNGLARTSRREDGSWEVENTLAGQRVRCLALDPIGSATVYAGTQGQGVFRSDDRGKTWRPAGLDGMIVNALAASPHEPGTLYAGTKPTQVYLSEDAGASWSELTGFRRIPSRWWWRSPAEWPFTAYVQAIALSPDDPAVILVGIEAGAVVRSADGGMTWTDHRRGALRDCHSMTFHASQGGWLYEAGGSGSGAAYSRDAGQTWTQLREGLDRHYGWACAADPARPDVWYISASRGPMQAHSDGRAEAFIFRSKEGEPWQKLSGGLPQPLDHMPYALLTDPAAPGHLYAGLSNGEVWRSADYGETWEKLPFGLGGIHRSLLMIG